MDKQDPTSGPQSLEGFQEPPQEIVRKVPEQKHDEQAGLQGYSVPGTGPEFTEAAAAPEIDATSFGIDPAILEAKRQIETQLLQPASQQTASVLAAESFQGSGNIVGVGVGLSLPPTTNMGSEILASGFHPGKQALNLYVVERAPVEEVRSHVVQAMGVSAASVDDMPVNVIVTGVIEAQPHRFRMRPAPGGISVGHFRVTAGTIACLSVGRTAPRDSRVLILSNNHVLADSNNGVFGDCICQPGTADLGACPADQVAVLERFVPINFTGAANFVDCATGWAWPDRVRRELVHMVGGAPQFFRIGNVPVAPALNMAVGKSGRTTQLTRGTIIDINASINVNYNGRTALFRDQISVRGAGGTLFSSGGDSGSSIWTWEPNRQPVGLLFAGGNGITFANKLSRVLAALDINLLT